MNIAAASLSDQYAIDPGAETKYNKELGQEEFLELMMQQLKNQDPMKPMDNGEFLGQMAQFSTVSGIEAMQSSLDNLSQTYAVGQTLQSAQLVGQEVLIESSDLVLAQEGPAGGRFELSASSSDVKLDIRDATGAQVRQIDLGEYPAGRHDFSWDGKTSDGTRLPPGTYTADITSSNGETYEAAIVMGARVVDSVEFGANGSTTLNTTMGEVLTLDDVRQIRQQSSARTTTNTVTE